ncbi:hypothetical protein [Parasutterella excrementihominis]|jgi:hypothetical protein|uniref:Uncharacterized protein n=1 Tax=Parasutterella excrementihominis TaxID=487175 RepID=A0A6I3S2V4_9BURK|nr:hypothetical protein [Parasutterella excrementihominis]MBS6957783.1 hypothetical protein [Pseudomonadota bacterium]MTT65514.1 hypothetical protein [Parasutterella excrementihominis]MTT74276.1 hypothetical protein [Parasutterella excrementihominis]MTT93824.1 hypothetical protein [Parasutterella excrementihominis]MTT97331.1 hypothetical protein [Parasutterella excrementihominis]
MIVPKRSENTVNQEKSKFFEASAYTGINAKTPEFFFEAGFVKDVFDKMILS